MPVFGKSTRELTWVLCNFTSETKEEKTNRHLYFNCRPFFAVCKAAQPRSSEKNATSRAGQTPCTRWAVGLLLTKVLKSETAENRAFEKKQPLVFLPKIQKHGTLTKTPNCVMFKRKCAKSSARSSRCVWA